MFLQFAIFHDVVEELATRNIFHDHENVGWCGNYLVQFDDVGMSEQFQILDFPANLANHIQTFDLLSIEDFYGNLES